MVGLGVGALCELRLIFHAIYCEVILKHRKSLKSETLEKGEHT